MNIYFLFLPCLLVLPFLTPDQSAIQTIDSEKKELIQIAKNEKEGLREEPRSDGDRIIEEYEREKLAKFKRNIGKRYLVIKTVRPAEFYKSPEDLDRSFTIQKEKEGFIITEVTHFKEGIIEGGLSKELYPMDGTISKIQISNECQSPKSLPAACRHNIFEIRFLAFLKKCREAPLWAPKLGGHREPPLQTRVNWGE